MNNKEQNRPAPGWRLSLLRNWLSLAGLIVAVGSLFSFLFVFVQDSVTHFTNPYIGILTYLVAPGFLFLGLSLAIIARAVGASGFVDKQPGENKLFQTINDALV